VLVTSRLSATNIIPDVGKKQQYLSTKTTESISLTLFCWKKTTFNFFKINYLATLFSSFSGSDNFTKKLLTSSPFLKKATHKNQP